MKIDGATVVVTGGARRIGRHISLGLAQRGANVVINYQSSEAEAHEVVEACVNMGTCAQAVQADISSKIGVETVRDAAISKFGGVDILINNAGITIGGQSVVDMPLEDWHKVIDVNLHSVHYMTTAALPHMRGRHGAAVVNIASNVVNTLPGGAAAYATTKAGVVALTKVLSKEEAQHGVRVNVISPGMIHAGMGVGALERRSAAVREQFLGTIPMRRSGGAEEVAAARAFDAAARRLRGASSASAASLAAFRARAARRRAMLAPRAATASRARASRSSARPAPSPARAG